MEARPIPIHLLDSQTHKSYNEEINNTHTRRTQLLAILQTLAYVRQLARAQGQIIGNAHSATAGIVQPLRQLVPANSETTIYLHLLLTDLFRATKSNTEHHAHSIALTLIDELEKLPEEGDPHEIEASKHIIKAYKKPTPTAPASPIKQEETPIPIPPPGLPRMESAATQFLDAIKKRKNPFLSFDDSDKENVNPNVKISGMHSPDMTEEVHRLKTFIANLSPYATVQELIIPTDYQTWVDQPNETMKQSYIKVIMSAFLDKYAQNDKYRGQSVTYAQVGPDNAPHFIGFSEILGKWMIADGKKKLFATMTSAV